MVDASDTPGPYERLLAQTRWLGRLAAQLVPPADREDLVQDVLLSAMRREGEPAHLRGWLATVARNLAARRRRREHNRRLRERSEARDAGVEPAAAESVESFAVHRAVVNAVMGLEEPYQTAVLLRFWEDLPPREVARRTGVPVETARTRIRRGVDRLRAQLDRRAGSRSAWSAPLLQIGAVREAVLAGSAAAGTTASAPILTGALAMKKTALATVAVALVFATIAMFTFGGDDAGTGGAASAEGRSAARAEPAEARPRAARPTSGDARVAVPVDAQPGSVLARVRYHDGSPAEDVGVYLRRRDGSELGAERRTGADGIVTFPRLAAGDYRVLLDRGGQRTVGVIAGQQSDCELEVAQGVTVRGRVVTMEEQPVAAAKVYALREEHHDLLVFLARTDGVGRFVLRDVATGLELYARADGWQPTGRRQSREVRGRPGETVEVEIELGARGYALHGQVLDATGRPAPRAQVAIAVDEDCRRRIDGLEEVRAKDGDEMLDREAFFVRADAEGRFSTTEVPWGDAAVLARGAGPRAHLVGGARVRVDRGAASQVVVHLRPGAAVFGIVRDEEGAPYEGITLQAEFRGSVELGELGRGFGHYLSDRTCVTAADGAYRLEGLFEAEQDLSRLLPTGEQHIRKLAVLAGQEIRLDLTVPRTWQLRVRVQDVDGAPLEGWAVVLSGRGSIAYRLVDEVRTGSDGVHVALGLRAERYVLSVHAPDPAGDRPVRRFPSFARTVTRGEATVVATVARPEGVIRGRVLDPAGVPVSRTSIEYALAGFAERDRAATDSDGGFRIERLPAGDYRLEVHAAGFPNVSIDVTLGPGENRALGDLALPAPAWLEVDPRAGDGAPVERPELWLSRAAAPGGNGSREERVAGLRPVERGTRWRNDPVEAGVYRLHVTGRGVAPVVRDVHLVAGVPRRLQVTCARGVVQVFDVVFADPVYGQRGEGDGWLRFHDARGRYLLEHHFQGALPDPARLALRTEVHLLPGSYQVSAWGRSGRARMPIDVSEGGGPPIVVVLR